MYRQPYFRNWVSLGCFLDLEILPAHVHGPPARPLAHTHAHTHTRAHTHTLMHTHTGEIGVAGELMDELGERERVPTGKVFQYELKVCVRVRVRVRAFVHACVRLVRCVVHVSVLGAVGCESMHAISLSLSLSLTCSLTHT